MDSGIKPIAEIRNAEIADGSFTLSLKVICAYQSVVHSPKVTLVFKYGEITRYIPLLIQSYYQNVDLKTCTIVAEYKYFIDNIFTVPIKDDEVKIEVDLIYGDKIESNIDLKLFGELKSDEIFVITDENGLSFKRINPYVESKNNVVLKILKFFIGAIYYILVRLIGIALTPWLLLDSLMAALGFKYGYVTTKNRSFGRYIVDYLRVGFKNITNEDIGRRDLKRNLAIFLTFIFKNKKVVSNRVTFLSNRRDDLSGNFEDIYEIMKTDESLDIQMLLTPVPMHRMSISSICKFAKLYATSAVVIIDDFYELTSIVDKKDGVKLVQVWHACGAFKTFGFSRLGKPGGPRQTNKNHRMYDRAIVSSSEIRRFYAEGFGIPISNVVATGVPRTDMFFSESIKEQKRKEFYDKYPQLKNKKIILFAPTFRGNGRLTGNYPIEKFNLKRIYEETNQEYAILVKMHPFVQNPIDIPNEYKDYIIDFSEDSELNDLLFVTDILITDYSSCVFEASLLNIPMIMYAYDLSEYIASRDFYYEYEPFVPGKIATTENEIISSINSNDFETEKIESFKKRFFDQLDGKASERVVSMIKDLLVI